MIGVIGGTVIKVISGIAIRTICSTAVKIASKIGGVVGGIGGGSC